MRSILTTATFLALTLAVSACACRPGGIGPYGGVHPARCWVW